MNMDDNSIFFTLPAADGQAGMRLDLFLRETVPAMSRARLQKLIAGGCVSLDDNIVADKDFKVRPGDSFAVFVPPAEEAEPAAENIPLDVVFEDDDLIVVNKPAGMTVHPAPGVYHGTLVNALLYHCRDNLSGVGGVKRPGIVHRIDKDTSGLLAVAKNDFAHQGLAAQFLSTASSALITPWFTAVRNRRKERLRVISPAAVLIARKWRWSKTAASMR